MSGSIQSSPWTYDESFARFAGDLGDGSGCSSRLEVNLMHALKAIVRSAAYLADERK